MRFDYLGYKLVFIQKRRCNDETGHLFTLIYKFFSPVTKYYYILHADYHCEDFFAIKFYAKPYRKSEFKYSKITNKGDIGNILITCAKVIPLLLSEYPSASFGFMASRTVDKATKKVENIGNNQRFKTYSYIVSLKFGTNTFAHYAYEKVSSYLLVNKNNLDVSLKERDIVEVLSKTYPSLPDIL